MGLLLTSGLTDSVTIFPSRYSFFFFFLILFIYLFIYFWLCWIFGSCEGFLQLRQVGATPHRGVGTALHRGARAFHYCGPSRCGAQAPDAQAQQLWLTSPAAPWHVGSSQTRARTRVSRISGQILNHCATREAPSRYSCLLEFRFTSSNGHNEIAINQNSKKMTMHYKLSQ